MPQLCVAFIETQHRHSAKQRELLRIREALHEAEGQRLGDIRRFVRPFDFKRGDDLE